MILKIVLTDEQKYYCEGWLRFWSAIVRQLTTSIFNEHMLKQLIIYEANTRQRKRVLKLLTGRHSKLKRNREWGELETYLEENSDADKRESYRTIPPYRSYQEGRTRSKANL
jgi:hypothetical protein